MLVGTSSLTAEFGMWRLLDFSAHGEGDLGTSFESYVAWNSVARGGWMDEGRPDERVTPLSHARGRLSRIMELMEVVAG